MERRNEIKLPVSVEALLDSALKGQLRAIAERVRDVVAAGIRETRAVPDGGTRVAALTATYAAVVQIFESESAGYFHHVPGGVELKRSFACTAGCAFCCHLHVDVTALEAVAIAATLASPSHHPQRQAVAATAPLVEGLGVERRRAARISCPLLREGTCSVYETRPLACRALYSTDARACEQVLLAAAGAPLPPIRSPAVPRALADSVAAGINAALGELGLQGGLFELTAALDALVRDAQAAARWLAGERVLPASPR